MIRCLDAKVSGSIEHLNQLFLLNLQYPSNNRSHGSRCFSCTGREKGQECAAAQVLKQRDP